MKSKHLILTTLLFFSTAQSAYAQSMRALSNGFSIGRSTGISSNFRQISNSEANHLIDILKQNISGDLTGYERAIPDKNYTIVNDLDPFSIVINRNSNTGGSSETNITNSVFSGHSHNIFMQ